METPRFIICDNCGSKCDNSKSCGYDGGVDVAAQDKGNCPTQAKLITGRFCNKCVSAMVKALAERKVKFTVDVRVVLEEEV